MSGSGPFIYIVADCESDGGSILGAFTYEEFAEEFARKTDLNRFRWMAIVPEFDFTITSGWGPSEESTDLMLKYPDFNMERFCFDSLDNLTEDDMVDVIDLLELEGCEVYKVRYYM